MSRPCSSKENAPTAVAVQPRTKGQKPSNKNEQDENSEENLFKKLNDLLRQNRKASKGRDDFPKNDFCCGAAIEQLPRIVVGEDCCWELKYPCDSEVCTKLLTFASKAPVGNKGSSAEAIGDAWQVAPEKVKILGQRWASLFSDSSKSDLLESIRKVLAPDCEKVSAKFCNLLIYEKDSFLKPYRDDTTQHVNKQLFGSIVVFLPSCYSGGEFIVEHEGSIRSFSFGLLPSSDDNARSHMVAFFSDCLREVKPVTSGYRVTMSYQLFFEGRQPPKVPTSMPTFEKDISESLSKLFNMPTLKGKEVAGLFLQHRYALASLSPIMLKGVDRVVYNAIASSGLFDVEVAAVTVSSLGQVCLDGDDMRTAERLYKEGITTEYGASISIMRYNPSTIYERHRCRSPIEIVANREWETEEDDRHMRLDERARAYNECLDANEDDMDEDEENDLEPRPRYERSPQSSSDEDVNEEEMKDRCELLSSFAVIDGCMESLEGPVFFINQMKDVRINDVLSKSTSATITSEGTEFELLYWSAALLIKPKKIQQAPTAAATAAPVPVAKKAAKRGRNK